MAKEFAFKQRFRQRRAVYSHEWFAGAFAVQMNGARGQFLAGAALSGNQHGRFGGRNLGDELIHLSHQGAFAYHVVFDIRVRQQSLIFALQHSDVPRVLDRYRRDRGNRGHQLQMILIKLNSRLIRIEINHAEGALNHDQRNT